MSIDDIDPYDVYEYFNLGECVTWIAVAIAINFVARPFSWRQRLWVCVGSGVFVFFGISDYFESQLRGPMPVWLWCYKIGCGALLLVCRMMYVGIRQFKWTDRFVLLLFGCLAASIATAVFHAWYTY